ncbi:sodium-coupled monocarboxylate transporter 2 [Drosophila mauritiana]|uniref:Sodium-coupled monocarboxylate transporter 2 n=1 Tax=Drosophila mauritiana TaxID=7226 RepID=A0A6P8KCG2_DROMA|nr:sodium-coupled monocarboxylate transporter 2 [Drosophila mauritiana]XP_033166825.1 sodium-coupled monocarboxylate transporter 2 [Drosophila mauritiana]
MDNYKFGTVDYVVLVGMTILSTGMGIYFGGFKKKQKNKKSVSEDTRRTNFGSEKIDEYLMGSRNMKVIPVSISLIGSFVSGVTIIGTPSEIYHYGTQYYLIILAIILQGIAFSYVYLPVYSALQIGSAYEYLGLRFSSSIRTTASFIYVFSMLTYLPFIVYVPALSLSQVSGINTHLIGLVIILACVAYTFMGGLKAVVHTDVWQVAVMFLSLVAVAVLGIYYSNGLVAVFDDAEQGGRLMLANTNPSPYVRHTVWSVLIGGFSFWTSVNAGGQHMVQRYMSLPSLKKSRQASFLFTIGVSIFIALCCFMGLLLFSKYKDCDPWSAGMISNDDQLLPLFVVQSVGHIYGMPGLFIAGIFGAGLSSLSSCFNTVSLVFLEDIVRGFFKMQPSERQSTILIKTCIIFQGIFAFLLLFLLQHLRGILSVCNSISSITAGTSFGIFTLGMLFPWANTIGTAVGGLSSVLLAGWISFGSQISAASGQLKSEMLPVSVKECVGNVTLPEGPWVDQNQVFPLYRLSYHWVSPIGVVTAVVVGALVSLLTKPPDIKTLHAELISPVIHRFLPRECFRGRNVNERTEESLIQ